MAVLYCPQYSIRLEARAVTSLTVCRRFEHTPVADLGIDGRGGAIGGVGPPPHRGSGAAPPAGVQGAEPPLGVWGAKPPRR